MKIKSTAKRKKRLGSGKGSGLGKTSGRGQKGSGARSGYSTHAGFEGGQMPLYRRLPHRGFTNKNFRKEYCIVNVSELEKVDASEIDLEVLIKAGAVNKTDKGLKVLGHGEISKAVTIKAEKFSASAKAKIEAAGGKVVCEAADDGFDEE